MIGIISSKDIQNLNYMKCGMGAMYVATLAYLNVTEYEKLPYLPFIDYNDPNLLFFEKEGYKGITNVWEYYFEQLNKYEDNNFELSKFIKHKNLHLLDKWKIDAHSILSDDIISKSHFVFNKFIKPKSELKSDIESYHITKNTLGVHIRGTDKQKEVPRKAVQTWIDATNKILQSGDIDKILICTDEEYYLNEYVKQFKDLCIYTESVRGSGNIGIHFQSFNREHDNYLKGFEVLRDILLLAKCEKLLISYSNVSTAAIVSGGIQRNNLIYI